MSINVAGLPAVVELNELLSLEFCKRYTNNDLFTPLLLDQRSAQQYLQTSPQYSTSGVSCFSLVQPMTLQSVVSPSSPYVMEEGYSPAPLYTYPGTTNMLPFLSPMRKTDYSPHFPCTSSAIKATYQRRENCTISRGDQSCRKSIAESSNEDAADEDVEPQFKYTGKGPESTGKSLFDSLGEDNSSILHSCLPFPSPRGSRRRVRDKRHHSRTRHMTERKLYATERDSVECSDPTKLSTQSSEDIPS